jgi:hypothetical protein
VVPFGIAATVIEVVVGCSRARDDRGIAVTEPIAIAVPTGVGAASGVACAADPLCEAQASRCTDSAGRNIEVTELSGIGFPADEGKVTTFMDRFTFGQRQHIDRLDSVATTTAATELKARIAAARGAGKN